MLFVLMVIRLDFNLTATHSTVLCPYLFNYSLAHMGNITMFIFTPLDLLSTRASVSNSPRIDFGHVTPSR